MFHTSHTPCTTLCAKLEALDAHASDLLADLYNSLSCRNRDTHYTWHRTSRRLVRQRGVSEECVIYDIVCKMREIGCYGSVGVVGLSSVRCGLAN